MTAAAVPLFVGRRFVTLMENCANPITTIGLSARELPVVTRALAQAGFARGVVYDRKGAPAIQTVSKVGVVQIGGPDGWQVEVLPKFGQLETFSMLQGLWALGSILEDSHDDAAPTVVASEGVHDFFVSWALMRIVRFLDRTLRREYLRRTEVLHGQVRGRIVTSAWAAHWARGQPFDIPCEHFVFDVDTEGNRVLRAGLEAVERYLVDFRPHDQHRRAVCRNALARLGAVRSVQVRSEHIRSLTYDHLTRHYRDVHAICALLIDGGGLGHHGDVDGVPFASFGFDLARAFQTLLLLLLRRVSGEDVRSEPRFYYDWLGSSAVGGSGRPHLKPDYVLATRAEVFDAKYKDVVVDVEDDPSDDERTALSFLGQRLRIDRADVYQAIAYTAHRDLRAPRVTFVFPSCRGDPAAFPLVYPLSGFVTRSTVRIGVLHLGAPALTISDRIKLWEEQVRRLLAV